VTVSYWGKNEIEVFNIKSEGFKSVIKSPPLPALVRSAILYNFGSDTSARGADYHPYVLAGLGDGTVVYFVWKDKQLRDKKTISLGHAPVSLTICKVDGKRVVFAAGSRSTVLSWEKKRVHTSPIMLKVSNFDSIHSSIQALKPVCVGDCWSFTFEHHNIQIRSHSRYAY
jgi:DNA damage-binding protein 1